MREVIMSSGAEFFTVGGTLFSWVYGLITIVDAKRNGVKTLVRHDEEELKRIERDIERDAKDF